MKRKTATLLLYFYSFQLLWPTYGRSYPIYFDKIQYEYSSPTSEQIPMDVQNDLAFSEQEANVLGDISNDKVNEKEGEIDVEYDKECDSEMSPGSGPTAPEFSSFESVSTDNMVNLFSGDFSYNLPLLEVPGAHDGGYAVSLSYNNVTNPEEEASWVGLGWTLNPGAINRNLRGFPDDIKGNTVTYINNTPKNWTVSSSASLFGVEAFTMKANASVNFRYNNYKGFGIGYTANVSALKGLVSLGYSIEDGEGSFSPNINPMAALSLYSSIQNKKNEKEKSASDPNKSKEIKKTEKQKQIKNIKDKVLKYGAISSYNFHSFSDLGSPTNVTEYTGTSTSFRIEASGDLPVIIGAISGLNGSYSEQISVSEKNRSAYGYLYSGDIDVAQTNYSNAITDYHLEKPSPFKLRDQYNPIPISDADYYSVSGEGIGGGFRAYWKTPGIFTPPSAKSTTTFVNAGVHIHVGADAGLGVDLTVGGQKLEMLSNWEGLGSVINNGNTANCAFPNPDTLDEPFVFRMNNDMAGAVTYPNTFDNIVTNVENYSPTIQNLPNSINSGILGTGRVGRSTYIRHFTNSEIYSQMTNCLKADLTKPKIVPDYDITTDFVNRNNTAIADQIGAFSLVNESGINYVYALPVFNRNELNMQYNVPKGLHNGTPTIYSNIDQISVCTGEKKMFPYAASYLLTSIRSADYSDLNNNGDVDDNDLGGYTKFGYRRAHGNNDKSDTTPWYGWRFPYSGLKLNQGQLHDFADDMGSFSCGEKEVYYLKNIETKTHVAVFITNKTNLSAIYGPEAIQSTSVNRLDGISANIDNNGKEAAKSAQTFGTKKSEFLDKIILYAKYYDGATLKYKVIKTVHFRYDYSSWPKADGNSSSITSNSGKLTLKKVWTEYNNVKETENSPFEFEYIYPEVATTTYPAKYSAIQAFYSNFQANSNAAQKPVLKDLVNGIDNRCADRWSNYQENGLQRLTNQKPYTNQTPSAQFDPAAWNLKQIKLPTGAEIHVQYEEDKYAYVQNERATAMFSLSGSPQSGASNTFKINIQDVYPNLSPTELTTYLNFLSDYYKKNEYIYFKFLYTLNGNLPITFPLSTCTGEYIDGYVKVHQVAINGSTIEITLGNGGQVGPIQSQPFNTADLKYPRYVCYDYMKTETGWQAGSCGVDGSNYSTGMGEADVKSILLKAGTRYKNMLGTLLDPLYSGKVCGFINPGLSYLRLPVLPIGDVSGKRGGGLRVKRLLMYDKGMETDQSDKVLYGTEYSYKDESNASSGVATNEPLTANEENVLIDFIQKRDKQKWYEKAISGKDKEQFEGPYGESYLPSATVGYSRVITKSIHTGKTDAGYSVNEFYTTKDYPTIGDSSTYLIDGTQRTPMEVSTISTQKDIVRIPFVLFNKHITRMWSAQGYRFFVNNMSGKSKFEAKYTGTNSGVINSNALAYSKEYKYYEPGERIPVVSNVLDVPTNEHLGVETEIIAERKYIKDRSSNVGMELDAAISLTVPFIIPTFAGINSINISETSTGTFVTNKTLYLPCVPKSTIEFKDGITHVNENVAFSKWNGIPLVTRSYDVYDGLTLNGVTHEGKYYSYTQPAASEYLGMNQKALNDNRIVKGFSASLNYSTVLAKHVWPVSGTTFDYLQLSEGDLLCFTHNGTKYYFHLISIFKHPFNGNINIYLERFNSTLAVNISGTMDLQIIRSGKRNFLNENVGNITTYNNINVPVVMNPVATGLVASRQQVINSINNYPGFNNPTSFASMVIQDANTPSDKKVKGGTKECLTCPCANMTTFHPVSGGAGTYTTGQANASHCVFNLVSWKIGGDFFIGIADPNRQINSAYYQAPYPPILTNKLFIPNNTMPSCTTNTANSALISYQKLNLVGGTFYLDPVSKYKVFYMVPGFDPIEITILRFCNETQLMAVIPNVVSNNASTYSQNWESAPLHDYKFPITGIVNDNFYKNNLGKFRPDASFAFKTERSNSNDLGNRVYNKGLYDLEFFGWLSPAENSKWIKASDVEFYSPYGEMLQEVDALDIPSASAYSNDKTQPILVAQNADHNSVYFESFEHTQPGGIYYTGNFGIAATPQTSHSGNRAIYLNPSSTTTANKIFIPFKVSSRILNDNLLIRFWASLNPNYQTIANVANFDQVQSIPLKFNTYATTFNANLISTAGTWALFEVKVPQAVVSLALSNWINQTSYIEFANNITFLNSANVDTTNYKNKALYIDDIRIQPETASMTAYVYDRQSKRLLASFDDKHFGLYYLYNAAGMLVRKLTETERGIKMLDERQYNKGKKRSVY